MGGGGGLTGKRQRERVGEAAKEAAPLVQCVLGEVRVGKGMVKGQVVIRLAEVVAHAVGESRLNEWAKNGELYKCGWGTRNNIRGGNERRARSRR